MVERKTRDGKKQDRGMCVCLGGWVWGESHGQSETAHYNYDIWKR